MSTARRLHYTYDQYLEVERLSSVKHEFLDGEIYAMAGGTPQHGILTAQVARLLGRRLSAECRGATSDVKILVQSTGLATYPDHSIICGHMRVAHHDANAVINPTLVVEVTSPSTEDYDRGDKLSHYKQIESLQYVLIVSHSAKRISVVTRADHQWTAQDFRSGETIELKALDIQLSVDEAYQVLERL